ncbi:MAG TPA: ABC transporter ATP-binding protein [Alphaproteobacteria bacterium]|nr:ABC transporter ATP-binding protein [Alphaproteobacteria bacterium]
MRDAVTSIENVSLTLGAFALRDINIALAPGEILVILGPNGAGKSVILETIAGFHRPSAGRILIRGRDVTTLPPEERHTGFIFQSFGLFPHLTVAENIAFGRRRGRNSERLPPFPSASDQVQALIERFALGSLIHRTPADLSPGEKQRVALARSLVAYPDLFLLDEPFSALDARTSETLREELGRFLREAGIPAIFVSHDQGDAAMLADRIAVIRDGRLVQVGTPAEVFGRPANRFVAEFLGMENILRGRIVAKPQRGRCIVEIAGRTLCVECDDPPTREAGNIAFCIRAEDIRLRPIDASAADVGWDTGADNRLAGPIVALTRIGALTRVMQDCGFPLVSYVMSRSVRDLGLRPGIPIVAEIDPAAIHLVSDA